MYVLRTAISLASQDTAGKLCLREQQCGRVRCTIVDLVSNTHVCEGFPLTHAFCCEVCQWYPKRLY